MMRESCASGCERNRWWKGMDRASCKTAAMTAESIASASDGRIDCGCVGYAR